jgi:uncharacterized membrane protein
MGIPHCNGYTYRGFYIYIGSFVVFFVTYLALACCESLRRKAPGNLIAMTVSDALFIVVSINCSEQPKKLNRIIRTPI